MHGSVRVSSSSGSSGAVEPQPHDVLRVLVVGETGVGKTLLVQRLCHDVFAPHCATDDSDSDGDSDGDVFLRTRWSPTIGFRVDALMRSTSAPLVLRAAAAAYTASTTRSSSSNMTRRRATRLRLRRDDDDDDHTDDVADTATATAAVVIAAADDDVHNRSMRLRRVMPSSNNNNNSMAVTVSTTTSRVQVVEFYEVGATRSFGSAFRLPLQLLAYDGIMLVYERSNSDSAAYLHTWYKRITQLYTQEQQQQPREHNGSVVYEATMPKLMLVGTQLRPMTMTTHHRRCRGRDARDEDVTVPYIVQQHQQQQWPRKRHRTPRPLGIVWHAVTRVCCAAMTAAQLVAEVVTLLSHPSSLQSPMYVEEYVWQQHVRVRWLRRVVVAVALLLTLLQRVVLLAMAVVLFGPRHDVVTQSLSLLRPLLRWPPHSEHDALARIRRDAQCIAHAHDCHLYSRAALAPAVDELLAFFDRLHHDKLIAAAASSADNDKAATVVRPSYVW